LFIAFLNYIIHSIFKLYFKLYALCAHPRSAFHNFHDPIVRVVKKVSENLKNVDNHIRFLLYEKFQKNQITLVIIKYSVHAFKYAKNLIIMLLLLI